MSSLTLCNRCTLNSITRRAEQRGATVTTSRDDPIMRGWITVRVSDKDEPVAFLLELTDECCC